MPLQETASTPTRDSIPTFDVSDPSVIEPQWGGRRRGADVASASILAFPTVSKFNVRFWASGAWTLEPYQTAITNVSERTGQASLVIPKAAFNVVDILVEFAKWRLSTDLAGMPGSVAGVAATGDYQIRKNVPASGTFNEHIPLDTPQPGDSFTVPMDRVGQSKTPFPANQGFCVRWTIPGISSAAPDYTWIFGFGQYNVVFRGDGLSNLWEYCQDSSGTWVTRLRGVFRHCGPSQVSNTAHSMIIFPHIGPNGEKIISFSGMQLDVAGYLAGFTSIKAGDVAPTEYVYVASPATRGTDRDATSATQVTISEHIRFDIRRDLKLHLQFSTIGFPTTGSLSDEPWQIPSYFSNANPMEYDIEKQEPGSTSIVLNILDAATGAPFVVGTDNKPYVRFDFTGDGTNTPILWGYGLARDAVIADSSPGSFTGGNLIHAAWNGAAADPSTVSGEITIRDEKNQLPLLAVRGWFPFDLPTTYTPVGGSPTTVHLFRGYAVRPQAIRRGRQKADGSGLEEGAFGLGAVSQYPSPNWHDYNIPIVGAWARLHERINDHNFRLYAIDPSAPIDPDTGRRPPWKVTDVVRDMLNAAGYPAGMIGDFDSPIRLWYGTSGKVEEWKIAATVNFSEVIVKLLRNFLGAYLLFDENAGTHGKWTVLFPSDSTTPIVGSFVTQYPSGHKPPHLPQAYPANTWPVFDAPQSYAVRPEFNIMVVHAPVSFLGNTFARVTNSLINYKSFNVPGASSPGDPTSPDWIGYARPACVIDVSLADPTNYQQSQNAVDFTVRRLFDFACHGQLIQPILGPLAFILDSVTGNYRPLRFQDPVNYNGVRYYVRSVSPDIGSDFHQMAHYELIKPIA